ncbi:MAG: hypothetical protein ACK4M0_13245 [Phreatobacter sp.]
MSPMKGMTTGVATAMTMDTAMRMATAMGPAARVPIMTATGR